MYVMESGGHRVAPVPTRLKKVVDYKSGNEAAVVSGGVHGGGGNVVESRGGTHIAATVKNTVRRLLRRTKSHRDAPSIPSAVLPINRNSTITAPTTNPVPANKNPIPRITPSNLNETTARKSRLQQQQQIQQTTANSATHQQNVKRSSSTARRYPRPGARLQVRSSWSMDF